MAWRGLDKEASCFPHPLGQGRSPSLLRVGGSTAGGRSPSGKSYSSGLQVGMEPGRPAHLALPTGRKVEAGARKDQGQSLASSRSQSAPALTGPRGKRAEVRRVPGMKVPGWARSLYPRLGCAGRGQQGSSRQAVGPAQQ